MNFIIKNLLFLMLLAIFSITPLFAQEMISYQVTIYQLPKDEVTELALEELIERSELIHQPSLHVKPNEMAKIEVGIQDIRMLEITLKSDSEARHYSTSLSQKQKEEDEINVMSSTTPNIIMGKEMHWRVSNAGWDYLIIIKGQVVKQPE